MRESRKNYKSIKKLAMISSFTALVLIVSTYAWFIGMKTVSVNTFDIEIKAADSLMLSLDGDKWVDTLDISEAILDEMKANTEDQTKLSYPTSTHSWGGSDGLIPMSSIGEMDNDSSRMKLFEKASFTASPGGYRLMASRVKNYMDVDNGEITIPEEPDGYIAFDLFVKNFTGTQYLKNYNTLDEEAIYLTIDSEVAVSTSGVDNTGIENSVRVAFAQIGRVDATTGKASASVIQGITCDGDGDGSEAGAATDPDYVTGICRTAQIWEPNDTRHIANAIRWYNKSCSARDEDGTDITSTDSFGGACGTVTDGIAYDTYAVRTPISSSDSVDTYDGPEYNTYDKSVTRVVEVEGEEDTVIKGSLEAYPYFKDSDKFLRGNSRPSFMTLAPNSITKVRVYVYIEGQDVDNYDYASIGKQISIKFGFTKERYTEDDINYTGPIVNQGNGPEGDDKTPPVITLSGDEKVTYVIDEENPYVDAGASATDVINEKNQDGTYETVPVAVTRYGVVNDRVPGEYVYTFIAIDDAENVAAKTRTVIVTETAPTP